MNETLTNATELLERVVGTRTVFFLRWLLFLPISLLTGAIILFIFVLGGANAARYLGEDVAAPAVLFSGLAAGYFSIRTGVSIAPSCPRIVAGITGFACVALAGTLFYWMWTTHQIVSFVSFLIPSLAYTFPAVVSAVILVFELHKKN